VVASGNHVGTAVQNGFRPPYVHAVPRGTILPVDDYQIRTLLVAQGTQSLFDTSDTRHTVYVSHCQDLHVAVRSFLFDEGRG
jgi:hypothetical protein